VKKIQNINPSLKVIKAYLKDIKASAIDLKSLMDGLILPIEKMEWWLLKYLDLYNLTKNNYIRHYYKREDGSTGSVPDDNPLNDELFRFKSLFEALNDVGKFYKLEGYFKKENNNYNRVSSSSTEVKKWVAKNEKLGAGTWELYLFSIESLDNIDDKDEICVYNKSNWEIYVDKETFKHTIEFFDVFVELFWIKEVYPESEILIRIKKEMSNIETKKS